jgi:hypothetical protein
MSKPDNKPNEFVMVIATVIGWGFCMAMVAGAYALGYWLAPFFGGSEHRDSFGILSAIVMIWIYEHRNAQLRWEKLNNQLGKLFEQRMPRL